MPAPANDNFADAQVLTGPSGTVGFDNTEATLETGETWPSATHSLWYVIVAPAAGTYTFSTAATPGDPDTFLAVYAAAPTDSIAAVIDAGALAADDDSGNDPAVGDPLYGTSIVSFPAVEDQSYMVQVTTYGTPTAVGVLSWDFAAAPPPPVPLGIGDAAVGVEYIYLVHDATTGTKLAELPLSVQTPFTRLLSGCGELQATLPITHLKATKALLGPQDRELSVWRNGAVVWHGPLTYVRAALSEPLLQIRAREASWYLLKRTLEDDQEFDQDVFGIVRALVDYATSAAMKTNATLYNFTVSAGDAGTVRTWGLTGDDRDFILNTIDDLASHPTAGFDYAMQIGGTPEAITRHLLLGAPALGSTIVSRLLEPGAGLYDLIDEADLDRAGNRVHVRPTTGAPTSLNNTGQFAAGHLLLEAVLPRPDLTTARAVDVADEFRRLAQPPVSNYQASYIPRAALPFGWCDLGDLVPLRCDLGYLTVDESRRVKAISVQPPEKDTPEVVGLTLALPLDELGA